jgi:hypothetical protein
LRRSLRIRKPNPRYANTTAHVAIVEDVLAEPNSFEEAYTKEEWCAAMEEEMGA